MLNYGAYRRVVRAGIHDIDTLDGITLKIPKNVHGRFLIALGSLILYALVFLAIYPSVGAAGAALTVIPAAVFGWFLGVRGGLLFGFLAAPVNMLLFQWVGNFEASGLIPNLLATSAIVLVSAGIGWIKDLNQRVKQQAEALQAERTLLQEEIGRRVRAEERLTHEAFHDPLTNLPNRRFFLNRLEQALAWNKRNPDDLCAVLYLDLDRFKLINDSLGHDAGDQFLIDVASRLKSSVRSNDTVARMGGDEFVILLEAAATPATANAIVNRIQERLTGPYEAGGNALGSGASIGVVMNVTTYDRIDDILRDADMAMYLAKAGGGNCFKIFDVAMRAPSETTHFKQTCADSSL